LELLAIKMGVKARDFIRTKEAVFKELNLQLHLDDEHFIFQKMSENPKLIERPIVVKGDKAILGRPPNKVEDFLNL
jgi:arsenate reductase